MMIPCNLCKRHLHKWEIRVFNSKLAHIFQVSDRITTIIAISCHKVCRKHVYDFRSPTLCCLCSRIEIVALYLQQITGDAILHVPVGKEIAFGVVGLHRIAIEQLAPPAVRPWLPYGFLNSYHSCYVVEVVCVSLRYATKVRITEPTL